MTDQADTDRLRDATDDEVIAYARDRIEELNLALNALGLRKLFWALSDNEVTIEVPVSTWSLVMGEEVLPHRPLRLIVRRDL